MEACLTTKNTLCTKGPQKASFKNTKHVSVLNSQFWKCCLFHCQVSLEVLVIFWPGSGGWASLLWEGRFCEQVGFFRFRIPITEQRSSCDAIVLSAFALFQPGPGESWNGSVVLLRRKFMCTAPSQYRGGGVVQWLHASNHRIARWSISKTSRSLLRGIQSHLNCRIYAKTINAKHNQYKGATAPVCCNAGVFF